MKKIKIFFSENRGKIEKDVNEFLNETLRREVLDVQFTTDEEVFNVMVYYKEIET